MSRPIKILIAEDDLNIRMGIVDTLESEGYEVVEASDGDEALMRFGSAAPDMVLLDIMMPGKSGYDVCRAIRKVDAQVPVIMLTAKSEEIDKVVGLELGADDYITKPFGVRELLARIAAVLRRANNSNKSGSGSKTPQLPDTFTIGTVEVDTKKLIGKRADTTIKLTTKEVALLGLFYQNPGEVLSRDDLLLKVWGVDYEGTTRTLDQHIAQLRKKVEPPEVISTVYGVGYRYAG